MRNCRAWLGRRGGLASPSDGRRRGRAPASAHGVGVRPDPVLDRGGGAGGSWGGVGGVGGG